MKYLNILGVVRSSMNWIFTSFKVIDGIFQSFVVSRNYLPIEMAS